jgi:microtubule-associated protein-like 6
MYGRIDGSRNVMSSSYMHNDAVTGMYDGSLILWKNREAKKRVGNAHTKAVTAMCAFSSGDKRGGGVGGDDAGPMILTGAADGLIIQWNDQLKRLKQVDLNVIPLPISINMCALSMMQGKVVVGTRGAEIFEVDWLSGEHLKIVDGHFNTRGELWGLAVRPTKPEFATAADDKTLRVWNARAQQPVGEPVDIGGKVRALAYSPDGFQLAAANFDGLVQVFNADDIRVKIGEVQLSKEWIQVMEFSPDGRMLAVGSHDSRVHVIDSRTFSTKNVLKGHHSSVIGIDFSADSKVLRSVSTDEELLFWDTATGKQITSASSVRDTKWATCRCVLGWGVQGIWPPFSDKTDVNSCDRSPDGSLLATGDDFHFVKLFKYPCVKDKSAFKAYKGHSEHVPTVRFSKCGSHLFSVGGIDKAIIQYSVKYPKNK